MSIFVVIFLIFVCFCLLLFICFISFFSLIPHVEIVILKGKKIVFSWNKRKGNIFSAVEITKNRAGEWEKKASVFLSVSFFFQKK